MHTEAVKAALALKVKVGLLQLIQGDPHRYRYLYR